MSFTEVFFFNLKKKCSSLKAIKLNKLFLRFFPAMHLNQNNTFLNQINNFFHFKKVKNVIS